MDLKFINTEDKRYTEAVTIRINSFFKGMQNTIDLIQDIHEANSIHIICIENEKVLGTGRLTIKTNKAIISQMAIRQKYRNKGIGSLILKALIEKSKALEATSIELSARKTAVDFYKKHNFEPTGNFYPSKKTGIIHQKMQRNI